MELKMEIRKTFGELQQGDSVFQAYVYKKHTAIIERYVREIEHFKKKVHFTITSKGINHKDYLYEYNLSICDKQFVEMPKGSQILSVAIQGDSVKMWALVDPDAEKEERPIVCHGTGHDASDVTADMFIGTILTYCDSLVFHFFDQQKGRNND